MGGFLGTVLLGVFASKAINGQAGLLEGDTSFFMKEFIAVTGAAIYAFLFTYGMLILINFITKVKVSEVDEVIGIDAAIHGEKAYDEGAL